MTKSSKKTRARETQPDPGRAADAKTVLQILARHKVRDNLEQSLFRKFTSGAQPAQTIRNKLSLFDDLVGELERMVAGL